MALSSQWNGACKQAKNKDGEPIHVGSVYLQNCRDLLRNLDVGILILGFFVTRLRIRQFSEIGI